MAKTKLDLTDRLTDVRFDELFKFLGIAFYVAEGIALVIPVRASFKNNEKFLPLYYSTFTFIVWIYVLMGVLSFIVK